jgi:hypothetical protein
MPDLQTGNQPEDDLSPEERDALIDELAKKVVDRRLETPTIMFLEMHKPVAFLAGQSMIVAGPLLSPLFGVDGMRKFSRLLSGEGNVERLIRRIEDLADEREPSKGKEE